MPLVPEGPLRHPQLDSLRSMTTADLFAGEAVASEDAARCVHAGLFLYFSALDESHTISQGVATASGSYWHGIMHRQEPDWSNAKYWFVAQGTIQCSRRSPARRGSPGILSGSLTGAPQQSAGGGIRRRRPTCRCWNGGCSCAIATGKRLGASRWPTRDACFWAWTAASRRPGP